MLWRNEYTIAQALIKSVAHNKVDQDMENGFTFLLD